MTKILGIAGTSRAGKSTLADFFVGYKMCRMGITEEFQVKDSLLVKGDIIVNGEYKGSQLDEFDHRNLTKDRDFEDWLRQYLYPEIKVYSLAQPLKDTCMSLFGLTLEQCYGLQKDSPTKVTRSNLRKFTEVPDGPEYLSAREVMVYFGSGVLKGISETCFIDALLKRIDEDQPKYAIIDDIRQKNEEEMVHKLGGQIIKLTRGENLGLAEASFNSIECELLIDNKEMSMREKCEAVMEFMGRFYELE